MNAASHLLRSMAAAAMLAFLGPCATVASTDDEAAVLWTGCSSTVEGCELGVERTMTFWSDRSQLRVRTNAGPLDTTTEAARGGIRARVRIPENATEVVLSNDEGASLLRFVLREPLARPSASDAEAEYQRCAPLGDGSGPACAAARGVRARALLGDPKRFDEALNELRVAAAEKARLGRAGDAIIDEAVLAYYLITEKRAFGAARDALNRGRAQAPPGSELVAQIAYLDGILASSAGDLRAALPFLRAARELAERLDIPVLDLPSRQAEAHALVEVGRREEARALLRDVERLSTRVDKPCFRGDVYVSLGWLSFELAVQDGSMAFTEAERSTTQALAIYRESCRVGSRVANALTGLAAMALARQDLAAASSFASEAWAESPQNLDVVLELLDVRGRLALSERNAERARETYDRMALLADLGALPRSRVRAATGRAEAFMASGNVDAAAKAFREAGDLVAGSARLVPLGEGRASFLDVFGEAARAEVELLLTTDVRAAARASRAARARGLDGLRWQSCLERADEGRRERWEREWASVLQERSELEQDALVDWQRPLEELEKQRSLRETRNRAVLAAWDAALGALDCSGIVELNDPAEGEVILVAQRLSKKVALFAVGRNEAVVALAEGSTREQVEAALEPLAGVLATARRIRIIAEGPLDGIDWHALPLRGKPFGTLVPIVYGLDLATMRSDTGLPKGALIVSDPRHDLPEVRAQVPLIENTLRGRGLDPLRHLAGDQASYAQVRKALAEGPAFFHYAGHAVYEGTDGAESQLFLASDTTLAVPDLLALPRAPENVVLVACEGARSATKSAASLGLAQALVLGGAQAVLAASRPVRSDDAAAFTRVLYEELQRSGELDLGELLRATAAKRAKEEGGDWAAFRVLVP